jgi:adenosylcobinamide-phosphate guanylyltransferase
MCGGEGTRLDAPVEKPLYPVAGVAMVERVADALAASRVDRTVAVTSPATPDTAARLALPTIDTPGEGYVADLGRALADDRVSTPALTVAADLPGLDGPAVDAVLDAADGSLTVAVPVGRKRALGLRVDTRFRHRGCLVAPAGINVVGDGDAVRVTRDPRFAVNVNSPADARTAEWLLAGLESTGGGCRGPDRYKTL